MVYMTHKFHSKIIKIHGTTDKVGYLPESMGKMFQLSSAFVKYVLEFAGAFLYLLAKHFCEKVEFYLTFQVKPNIMRY